MSEYDKLNLAIYASSEKSGLICFESMHLLSWLSIVPFLYMSQKNVASCLNIKDEKRWPDNNHETSFKKVLKSGKSDVIT